MRRPASPRCLRFFVTSLVLGFAALAVHAQPSGGPYGPQPQTYAVPAAAHVYYVAPDAPSTGSGASLAEPAPLASVVERVVTGDAIILRGGVYRIGGLRLNQGVTLQPYADEHPILKGTQLAEKWETQGRSLWRTDWPHLFPQKPADWWRRLREGRKTPQWLFNNDMVFCDGRFLRAVGSESMLDDNSYFIDYEEGRVYLGFDPAGHTIEITAFDSALVRTTADVHGKSSDRRGPVIRGLTFTQYAYRALEVEGTEPAKLADPATFGKEVAGTILEDVTITFCSRVAGYFRGDGLVIRRCLVSDTSTEGIYIIDSADVLLEKNIFQRNNIEGITGYYPSAVKIFNQSYRVTCRDNLVRDNRDSNGIWYDVGNVNAVFVNNWIEDCQDGFFFEISKGAIVAGNVFRNCENGSRSLNSSDVHIYHNTYVNAPATFERNERSAKGDHFGWHPSTGPDVDQREGHIFVANLLAADASYHRPLLRFVQSKLLAGKLTRPAATAIDHNVYIRATPLSTEPLIAWSPAATDDANTTLAAPADLQKLDPRYEPHGRALAADPRTIFTSLELERYTLASPASLTTSALLPEKIASLLHWPVDRKPIPGAYQP